MDIYFSADVETDGPIPGPYSMLSFGIVLAGTFDGDKFQAPEKGIRHQDGLRGEVQEADLLRGKRSIAAATPSGDPSHPPRTRRCSRAGRDFQTGF